MLKTRLQHPEILAALAASGHFSQVLIADGNFPVAGNRGPHARVVHLNLAPGMLDALTVLDVLLEAVPVQAATVMAHRRITRRPCFNSIATAWDLRSGGWRWSAGRSTKKSPRRARP